MSSPALLAAATAAALLAMACPSESPVPAPATPAPTPGGGAKAPEVATGPSRLRWGTQQEPNTLQPILSDMAATTHVCNLIHGYFVRIDNEMNLVPDLIEELPTLQNGGISADYLTYTYHLRKDATFQDGSPVTSEDVSFTHALIMNPKVNAYSRDIYDKVKSIDTPDEHTVVFHLTEVFAPFNLIFNEFPILPKHLLADKNNEQFNTDPYNRNPVGAGPYKVKNWVSGSHIELTAYENYFRGKPKIDEIDVKFIPEEQVLMVQMQTQELDYYDNANTSQYDELKKIPGLAVYTTPANTYEHIDFQCRKPELADKRIRQAVGYAIDRNQISQKVYRGLWKPAYSNQSPLSWAYNKDNESVLVYDPERAKTLLDEAGWKDTDGDGIRDKGGKRLELVMSTTVGRPLRERTEQVVQEQLKQVGIALSIKNYNATLFFGTVEEKGILKTGDYDLGLFAWLAGVDPDDYTIWGGDQFPPVGQNSTFWKNDRATELLKQGRGVVDRDKRVPLYREIQKIIADDMPMVPLLYWVNIDPVTDRLRNFKPNPTRQGNTWNAWEWELGPPAPKPS
ncbi:MAG: peptide ABC transporter substrate-binding protein [Acidobacteriota bacterium]